MSAARDVASVTGTSAGIGRASAMPFGRRSGRVFGTVTRNSAGRI